MPFHVKSAEATALLEELRRATGEGVTEAVTEALRLRLARVREERDGRADAFLAAVREMQESPIGRALREDPRDWRAMRAELYDADGLPR